MATSAEPASFPQLERERRSAARKLLSGRSLIELQPGRGGSARDVSEGGVSLSGGADLTVGSETRVRFALPDSTAHVEASGVIAWANESATGIRFVQIEPESLAALQHWLENASSAEERVPPTHADAVLAAKVACLREIADLQAEISAEDLDPDAALAIIVRRLAELTRSTGAAIALRDGEQVICRASYGNAPDVGVPLSKSSLSGECLRTANVVLLQDSETDSRVDAEICRQLNFRSLLIVPVMCDGKAAGIAEVLSPIPGNFEGADILVVSFMADLVAGIAVPAEQTEAPTAEKRISFEPLLEQHQPIPEIAFELPIPATPVATPLPIIKATEPVAIVPEHALAPAVTRVASGAAQAASIAAVPQPTRAGLPASGEQGRGKTVAIAPQADWQKRLPLLLALVAILLIAIAFAILRLRKASPGAQPAPATSAAITSAPVTMSPAQPVSVPVSEPPKPDSKRSSVNPSRSAKSSQDSHNGSATREIVVRESSSSTTNDAPPDGPSLGQLSARSSADLAAQIIATSTPAPELTPTQSSGVVEGKLIRKVLPRYPEMARRAGIGGDVVLRATIGFDGKLKNIKVESGSPLLREEAIAAARQWRYSPYLLGGKPVETDTRITISFKR